MRKVTLAAVLLLGFTTAAAATTCKQRADNCERNQGGPGCHDAARMAACAKNKLYISRRVVGRGRLTGRQPNRLAGFVLRAHVLKTGRTLPEM